MTDRFFQLPGPRPLGLLATAVLLAAGTVIAGGWGRGGGSGLGARPVAEAPGAAVPGPSVSGSSQAGSLAIPGAGTALPVIGSLPALDHNVEAWTRNLRLNPHDFLAATNLATLYQARARMTADLADYERGLEAATTAQSIAAGYPPARLAEAAIRFSLHDFGGALTVADALVREDPSQLGALATRADAEIELGQLAEAKADLEALAAATGGPALAVRRARLAAVTGDLDAAVRLATEARDAARSDGVDVTFYDYALAEYARQAGAAATAREGYEAVLASRPRDLGSLLGLARIQAYDGELDAAIATLAAAVEIAPAPEAEALMGDLLLGRAEDSGRTAAERDADRAAAALAHGTVRLTRRLSDLAGAVYDRQLVLFDLDHGGASPATLEAARAGLEIRPDAAGHDLVAWALHRLGREVEAWAESDAARATGAADARTLAHAGQIAAALGRPDAIDLLTRAIDLGPALDPLERRQAEAAVAAVTAGSVRAVGSQAGTPGSEPAGRNLRIRAE